MTTEKKNLSAIVRDEVRNLIIYQALISFAADSQQSDPRRALEILEQLSPNNILTSKTGTSESGITLEIWFSLPLSGRKFQRAVEIMKSAHLQIIGWEKLTADNDPNNEPVICR